MFWTNFALTSTAPRAAEILPEPLSLHLQLCRPDTIKCSWNQRCVWLCRVWRSERRGISDLALQIETLKLITSKTPSSFQQLSGSRCIPFKKHGDLMINYHQSFVMLNKATTGISYPIYPNRSLCFSMHRGSILGCVVAQNASYPSHLASTMVCYFSSAVRVCASSAFTICWGWARLKYGRLSG